MKDGEVKNSSLEILKLSATLVGYKLFFVEVCINYFGISSPPKYPAIHAHMKCKDETSVID